MRVLLGVVPRRATPKHLAFEFSSRVTKHLDFNRSKQRHYVLINIHIFLSFVLLSDILFAFSKLSHICANRHLNISKRKLMPPCQYFIKHCLQTCNRNKVNLMLTHDGMSYKSLLHTDYA